MNDVELAWVVGLLEGEGCFSCSKRKTKGAWVRVHLLMSDRDIVEKCAKLIGVTSKVWIVIPKGDRAHCKTMYGAALHGINAIKLMKLVLPYMGNRRTEKINDIIAFWDKQPHRRSPRLPAVCHPERKHRALGLCKNCYEEKCRRDRGVKARSQSLIATRPWESVGMTRSVWYHRNLHRQSYIERPVIHDLFKTD